jgi:hypothetical protein
MFSNAVFFFNIAAIAALCGFLKTTDFRSRKPTIKMGAETAGEIV